MATDLESEVNNLVDARGLRCPEPLMLVKVGLRKMVSGTFIKVYATDPSTSRDLKNLCRFMGHKLLSENEYAEAEEAQTSAGTNYRVFVIKKA